MGKVKALSFVITICVLGCCRAVGALDLCFLSPLHFAACPLLKCDLPAQSGTQVHGRSGGAAARRRSHPSIYRRSKCNHMLYTSPLQSIPSVRENLAALSLIANATTYVVKVYSRVRDELGRVGVVMKMYNAVQAMFYAWNMVLRQVLRWYVRYAWTCYRKLVATITALFIHSASLHMCHAEICSFGVVGAAGGAPSVEAVRWCKDSSITDTSMSLRGGVEAEEQSPPRPRSSVSNENNAADLNAPPERRADVLGEAARGVGSDDAPHIEAESKLQPHFQTQVSAGAERKPLPQSQAEASETCMAGTQCPCFTLPKVQILTRGAACQTRTTTSQSPTPICKSIMHTHTHAHTHTGRRCVK